MYNLFGGQPVAKPQKRVKKANNADVDRESLNATEGLEEIKIGALVRSSLDRLIQNDLLDEDKVEHLTEERYSKPMFNLNYSFLKEVVHGTSKSEQMQVNNRPRYYANTYVINGEEYLFCSQWIESSRRYFTTWLDRIEKRID